MKKSLLFGAVVCLAVSTFGQCVPEVTLTAAESPVCFGNTTTFTAEPGANAGSSPTYTFTSQFFGELQSGASNQCTPTFIFDADIITVEMVVNDGCGLGESAIDNVSTTITYGPTPIINEPSTDICDGNSYELTADVDDENSYEWFKDGQATGNKTKTFNVTEEGEYIIIEDNGSCPPEESDPKTIGVLDVPTVNAGDDVTVAPGNSTTLNGSSDFTTNISWSPATALDDANSLTPVCTPENTTIYTLTSYNQQCFASDQVQVTVSFLTNTSSLDEHSLHLFPNPATSILNIPHGLVDFYIYNAAGEMLDAGYGEQLDISRLPEGFYKLIMNVEGEMVSEKFTITR